MSITVTKGDAKLHATNQTNRIAINMPDGIAPHDVKSGNVCFNNLRIDRPGSDLYSSVFFGGYHLN